MKILYFNVIEQHAGWGAEWFLNAAFESLGHETLCIDYRANRHRLAPLIQDCGPVHAVLVQRGDRFPTELLRASKAPCFFLATELFHRRPDQYPLFQCDALSHVFVRTRTCLDEVVGRGWQPAERVSILLSSFDPVLHRRLPEVEKDIDVLFLGGITERRRRILDSLPRDLAVVEVRAFGEEMIRYFNRARIILNIHAGEHLDVETRIYEALGSGGFVISEKLAAENPFTGGQLVQLESIGELADSIRHYLAHDAEREKIAEQGYREAQRAHTYRARARQIVSVIGECVREDGLRSPFARDPSWYLFRATEGSKRVLSLLKRAVGPGQNR